MFVQNEERGQTSEDWFEGEEDGGVGGGEVSLGPALDGEGGGGGEQAGDGKSDEETRRDREVRLSAKWQRDGHDARRNADLERGELAGWDSMRGVGEGKQMAGEGDGAGESEEVSSANADEEVLERCSPWSCEEEQAGEGK